MLIPSSLLYWNSRKEIVHGQATARSAAVQPDVRLAELRPAVLVCDPVSATPLPRESRAVKMNPVKSVKTLHRVKVTAYCICEICCEGWSKYARTATGDDAKVYDGVAADPKLLPYRTKLDIPGIGVREVDDTGGGMRKSAREGVTHIDVRMASHNQARQWGIRWLTVRVL